MPSTNNPAGRLVTLFEAAREVSGRTPVHQVLDDLLGHGMSEPGITLGGFAQFLALVQEAQRAILAIPDINHQLYLEWAPKLEQTLKVIALGTKWEAFRSQIDDKTMYSLQICAELLGRGHPDSTLDEATVQKLRDDLWKLHEGIKDSDIEDDLKDYMFVRLESVDRALQEWQIRGIRPVEEAFEAVVGSLVLNRTVYARTRNTAVGEQFWRIMERLAVLVSITVGTISIGKDVNWQLPGPEQESAQVEPAAPSPQGGGKPSKGGSEAKPPEASKE